jgi:hypothetical protein
MREDSQTNVHRFITNNSGETDDYIPESSVCDINYRSRLDG